MSTGCAAADNGQDSLSFAASATASARVSVPLSSLKPEDRGAFVYLKAVQLPEGVSGLRVFVQVDKQGKDVLSSKTTYVGAVAPGHRDPSGKSVASNFVLELPPDVWTSVSAALRADPKGQELKAVFTLQPIVSTRKPPLPAAEARVERVEVRSAD
jgi:hypothetical protein